MSASASETETQRLRLEQKQPFFFFLVEELITEILSWLPVKSLIRFKCVSKSWNSLISHPSFIQLHLLRSSKLPHHHHLILSSFRDKAANGGGVPNHNPDATTFAFSYPSFATLTHFFQNLSSPSSSDQPLLRLNARYNILGSCNGLVCLLYSQFGQKDCHFLFWNPATRLLSPKLPFGFPNSHWFKFGFGYDKLTHTYKLVSLAFDYFAVKDSDRTHVKVYTFGSGSGNHCWREIQRFPEFPFTAQDEGIFLSGTLNWVGVRNFVTGPVDVINWHEVTIDKFVIVSLDLGNETYKQFSLPPFGPDEMPDNPVHFNPVMEVFLDCLCLSYDCNKTHFIMWQMKQFGVEKSWTRFLNVSYQHLQIVQPERMVPFCISENGDVLIVRNNHNVHKYKKTILYNRRNNRVQLTPTIRDRSFEIYVKGYTPSLVSPY